MASKRSLKHSNNRQVEAKNGFLLLVLSLFAMLVLPAFFERANTVILSSVTTSIVLLAALYLVAYNRKELIVGLLLAIPSILTNWWAGVVDHHFAITAHFCLSILYLGYISYHIFRYLFATRDVSVDMMYAAVCLYLILGMIWGMLYALLQLSNPDSFQLHPMHVTPQLILNELFYFSYVTLSTLGYGDVVPVTRLARQLSIIEAIIGQFYLAFVVARLVGLYITAIEKD